MKGSLRVTVESDLDASIFEELEDKIRDLLEQEGISATIDDYVTGNTTVTRKEEMGREYIPPDIRVKGELAIGGKIWFNDALRCRLRICGFSKEQQEMLRRARLVDLTLSNHRDNGIADVMIDIRESEEIYDGSDCQMIPER